MDLAVKGQTVPALAALFLDFAPACGWGNSAQFT